MSRIMCTTNEPRYHTIMYNVIYLVLKDTRIDSQRHESQSMAEHLIVDDARVVHHEHVLDGNCRHLSDNDTTESVGQLRSWRMQTCLRM